MWRKVKPSLEERRVPEKFAMVYIELGSEEERYRKPTRATLWHVEDELRPTQTLCGLELHGHCVSASPALAMMATPCGDCLNIVKLWVDYFPGLPAEQRKAYIRSKVGTMLRSDLNFRSRIHDFLESIYKESLLHVREENEDGKEVRRQRKAPSGKRRGAKGRV
jgi:hypothetical protein